MKNDKFNILFIDDSKVARENIVEMLDEYDYNIFLGESAKEAIRLLGNHEIDLIFMDYQMPEIDGFQAIKIIRNNNRTKFIPIIILTAKDPKKLLEDKGLELGAIDYLTKPISQFELFRTIELYKRFIRRENEINNELIKTNKKLNIEIEKRKDTENNLKISHSELESALEVKNKFWTIIAHDLRSPFNGLLGLLDMMVVDNQDLSKTDLIEMIGVANGNALKLFKLVENLLTWSKLQTGSIDKMGFNSNYFKLNDILENAIGVYKLNIKNKNIELLNTLNTPVLVYFDKMACDTILRNLLSNAIKFTPEGGKITIGVEIDNEETKIIIKDTGIGIKKEFISKLFDSKVIQSTIGTNNEEGSGLGLLISKEIAKQLGGDISIQSVENMGTEVVFIMPSEELI